MYELRSHSYHPKKLVSPSEMYLDIITFLSIAAIRLEYGLLLLLYISI